MLKKLTDRRVLVWLLLDTMKRLQQLWRLWALLARELCTLLFLASIFQRLKEPRATEEVCLASAHACPEPLNVLLVRRSEWESYTSAPACSIRQIQDGWKGNSFYYLLREGVLEFEVCIQSPPPGYCGIVRGEMKNSYLFLGKYDPRCVSARFQSCTGAFVAAHK